MSISGGTVTLRQSEVVQSSAKFGAAFTLSRGELHLTSITVERSLSEKWIGTILYMPSATTGHGPLFVATFVEFRQRQCSGSLFFQEHRGQIVLRAITFTPLSGCDGTNLASPNAFEGVVPKNCSGNYTDTLDQTWGVCSSESPRACAASLVPGTVLESLTCHW